MLSNCAGEIELCHHPLPSPRYRQLPLADPGRQPSGRDKLTGNTRFLRALWL